MEPRPDAGRANGRHARSTYEDLENVASNLVAELIDEELFTSPRPAGPHARAASVLGSLVLNPYGLRIGGPGGWNILFEPELHFDRGPGHEPDVLVPDIAGWRIERMADVPQTHVFDVTPDWVCEVLSPSTERKDRLKKLPVYHREGVRHVWIVSPLAHVLEVYRHSAPGYVLAGTYGDADLVRVEPFDAIELDLKLLWSPPQAATPKP